VAYPNILRNSQDDLLFAAFRVWAADIRDRVGRNAAVLPVTAWRAGLLAQALDSWDQCCRRAAEPDSASNLAEGLEAAIEGLVQQILTDRVQLPAELARIAQRT
jgi:hypothetical protein